MTNRRKFLMQGSFAATALLFTNPFKAIAGMSSPFTGSSSNFSHITFLHTANSSTGIASQVSQLSGSNNNIVLLYAGKDQPATNSVQFDASSTELKESWNNSYTIINKAGVKTGVIAIPAAEATVLSRVNEIAAYLKKEKGCKLVVFMSDLGYKNKNKIDDITVASKSEDIDIIISKFNKELPSQTYIAYNKHKSEVIIQHQHEKEVAGKINIAFNAEGVRNGVSF